jgi:hypothetical protein
MLLLSLMLLAPVVALPAQEGTPGLDAWVSAGSYPPTLSGCLVQWGFYYYVIGNDGTLYNLTRETSGLSHYVGHEVEVTGKPTVISLDTTVPQIASSVQELPALEVKSVKELSATCTSPMWPVPASCVQPPVECRTPH